MRAALTVDEETKPELSISQGQPGNSVTTAFENAATILVVDDEEVNRAFMSRILEKHHYKVILASDAYKGMEILKRTRPDLILTDIIMPGIDGYEFCRNIRKTYSQIELPVIMVTVQDRVEKLVEGLDCGANDYVAKPVEERELIARIASKLRLKGIRPSLMADREMPTPEEAKASRLQLFLDTSESAILFFNEANQITFGNRAATRMLDYELADFKQHRIDDILFFCRSGKKEFDTIIPLPEMEKLVGRACKFVAQGKNGNEFTVKAFVFRLDISQKITYVAVIQHDYSMISPAIEIFGGGNNTQSQKMNLEIVCETVLQLAATEGISVVETLLTLEESLEVISSNVSKELQTLKLRKATVELMKKALLYWENNTGKTKIDFAEESHIWKVYLDRSCFRTRTLDRYLHVKTLPKKPRWNDVIRTVEYVLSYPSIKKINRRQLENGLLNLKDALKNEGLYDTGNRKDRSGG